MKKSPRATVIAGVMGFALALTPGLVHAEEGNLSSFSVSSSISSTKPAQGSSVTLKQTITNKSGESRKIRANFHVGWGVNQPQKDVVFKSGSCTGPLASATFKPAVEMSGAYYSATLTDFPTGQTANCSLVLSVSSAAALDKKYTYGAFIETSDGGFFSKQSGSGSFTISQAIPPTKVPATATIQPSPTVEVQAQPSVKTVDGSVVVDNTPPQSLFARLVDWLRSWFN